MTGMDPYLPIDSLNPSRAVERIEGDVDPLGDRDEFLDRLKDIAEVVREEVVKNQEKMKARHDDGLKEKSITPGDLVMVIEKPIKGDGRKLKYRKHGPYRVVEPGKSKNTWQIKTLRGNTKTMNTLDLEIYHPREGDPRAELKDKF
jgi:hypothetical protein